MIAIKSDGYWELTALNIRVFAKFFYSGHGNFAFWNLFNQYVFKSDTKIAFTHYGSGEFLLNNVNISSQLEQQVVEKLAEGIGYQTIILEIPPYQPSLTYCFEVITDGRWSFEFVTED